MKNKHFLIIALTISVLFLATVIYSTFAISITNFDECIAAGNPAMESYPRQCRDPLSDQTFVEVIDEWKLDPVQLMQHESEGFYGCFGCSEPKEGPALCIDPIQEMKLVEETSERYCNSDFEIVEVIGGERDANGCLGPAGYSWNETLEICLREWEITGYDRQIIEHVMVREPTKYGKTLVEIVPEEACEACFTVWFDTLGRKKSVDILGDFTYTCSEESRNADVCIAIFDPVCGYMDGEKIQCIRAPCANTYSNSCLACLDENVLYYSNGECQ